MLRSTQRLQDPASAPRPVAPGPPRLAGPRPRHPGRPSRPPPPLPRRATRPVLSVRLLRRRRIARSCWAEVPRVLGNAATTPRTGLASPRSGERVYVAPTSFAKIESDARSGPAEDQDGVDGPRRILCEGDAGIPGQG